MTRSICLGLFFILGISIAADALTFQPTLSLLRNYTFTKNDVTVQSGTIDIENRKVNVGIELTNNFRLNEKYFVRTGISYNKFKTYVSGTAPVSPGTSIWWQSRYAGITVPVQIGSDFVLGHGHKGDFYAGVSVGVFTIASVMEGVNMPPSANPMDTVTTTMRGNNMQMPTSLLATANAGFSYQLFRSAPRLRVGTSCSAQLNKTALTSYEGTVTDTHGNVSVYRVQHRQQFINWTLSVSYTFGKLKQAKQKSAMLPTE